MTDEELLALPRGKEANAAMKAHKEKLIIQNKLLALREKVAYGEASAQEKQEILDLAKIYTVLKQF